MKLIHRIGYYLGGFSIGLILLAFFLSGKKTSCSYGPDARVLKNIRLKNMEYSKGIQADLLKNNIDSTAVNYLLRRGNINFSKSDSRKEPCATYLLEGDYKDKEIELIIENCETTATVIAFKVTNND